MTQNFSHVPVVFAINNNFVKQVATVMVSILQNSDQKTCFEFHILSADLTEGNKKNLGKIKTLKSGVSIHFIDMKPIICNANLKKYMTAREGYQYITVETYFRFFIPQIFKQYDKIIYLDADILVFQDLKELYETDISDYAAGVVRDPFFEVCVLNKNYKTETEPHLGMKDYAVLRLKKKNLTYFNAGVLLLNLDKIRKEKLDQKLWRFAYENSPLEFQDQDVLNAVLENRVFWLDKKWNVLKEKSFYAKRPFSNLMKPYKNPAIFHFTGADKPWRVVEKSRYGYAFLKEWWRFYQLTPPHYSGLTT